VRPPAAAALIALVLLSGCRSGSGKPDPEPAPPPGRACRATLDEETRRYLDENQELYVHARRAGREWLDGLEVDHIELRRHGIKGKKKVVEHLDAYAWLLRDPLPGERAACLPYLYTQIDWIDPRIIILLGATALKGLIDPNARITRVRGEWMQWRGRWVMPTYHPSALLRNPQLKRAAWEDFKKVIDKYRELVDPGHHTRHYPVP